MHEKFPRFRDHPPSIFAISGNRENSQTRGWTSCIQTRGIAFVRVTNCSVKSLRNNQIPFPSIRDEK